MARNATAKEEVKVLALELESIELEDGRTVSRVDSQIWHEVMEVVQARGGAGPAKVGDPAAGTNKASEDGFKTDPNLVMEPVQACGGAVTGKAGDVAAVTNKASEDEQKTAILDPNLVLEPVQVRSGAVRGKTGNAAVVTNKASEDERKITILNPKLVKHAKAFRSNKHVVVKARCSEEQVVAKKGKDKKGKQKEVVRHDKPPILADVIPEPTATLNIQNLPESYEECVKNIAKKIKEESSQKFIFIENGKEWCVPVTLGPDDSPSGVYVIKLTDGKDTLLLVARKYQTWFTGIVTTNGERFEVEDMELKTMMAGSKSLYTDSRYSNLLRDNLAVCRIGFDPLIRSFGILAGHVGQNKGYKEAIAVLLIMLFEGPRFPAVFEKNMKLLREEEEDTVGEELKMLINNWCDISMEFYMANGEEKRIILTDQTSEKIRKVATGVSLLCGSKWIKWQEANSKKKVKISTRMPRS